MSFDLFEKIIQLRAQSLSIADIARECELTVGQVKYQLRKIRRQSNEMSDIDVKKEEVKETAKEDQWLLPDFYGENVVKMMPQSPTTLFVYWEITWARMRMVASYLQTDYRHIQKGLRLYDVTDCYFDGANAHSYRDVVVHEGATSWYLSDLSPGRTYTVDFGLFHEGKFCPILRSNPVATPRNTSAVYGEPLVSPAANPNYPAWFENFSSYSVYSK